MPFGSFINIDKEGSGQEQYKHPQLVAASVWNVNHNLGYRPSGNEVEDSAGNTFTGCIKHIDDNNLTITFSSPFAGCSRHI